MQLTNIFDIPIGYLGFQFLIGGVDARRRCIKQHVPVRRDMRVLDIGCGPGYVAGWLDGVSYVGLDTDPNYIDYANRKYAGKAIFSCELLTDAYADRHKPFDFVIMMGVLHHLDDAQTLDILRIIRKVLTPKGRLVTLDGFRHPNISSAAKFFLDNDRGKYVRTKEEYVDLCCQYFQNVTAIDHPEYFRIPYTTIVLECEA